MAAMRPVIPPKGKDSELQDLSDPCDISDLVLF